MIFHLVYEDEQGNLEVSDYSGRTNDRYLFMEMKRKKPDRIFMEYEPSDLMSPKGVMNAIAFIHRIKGLEGEAYQKELDACLREVDRIDKRPLPNRQQRRKQS